MSNHLNNLHRISASLCQSLYNSIHCTFFICLYTHTRITFQKVKYWLKFILLKLNSSQRTKVNSVLKGTQSFPQMYQTAEQFAILST